MKTPHEDNSPPDKNKAQPLPTRTTIPRTIPHQDNSPLGPLPRNKTNHQDQNLYGGELSSWGVVRIQLLSTIQYFEKLSKSINFHPQLDSKLARIPFQPQDSFGEFGNCSRSSESARNHQKTPPDHPAIVLNDIL